MSIYNLIENYENTEDFENINAIIGVAFLDYDDENNLKVFWLPKPNRHHHLIQSMEGLFKQRFEQGFISNNHIFLRRKPALRIAEEFNLLIKQPISPSHGLFSEDVW